MEPPPTPSDVVAMHDAATRTLRSVEWQVAKTNVASPYYGLDYPAFAAKVKQLRAYHESCSVLALVASVEAALCHDMDQRILRRRKGDVWRDLRDLKARVEPRYLALGELVDFWARCAGIRNDCARKMRLVVRLRNQLAHGQRWTDKTGVPCQFEFVASIALDFLAAIPDMDPAWLPAVRAATTATMRA